MAFALMNGMKDSPPAKGGMWQDQQKTGLIPDPPPGQTPPTTGPLGGVTIDPNSHPPQGTTPPPANNPPVNPANNNYFDGSTLSPGATSMVTATAPRSNTVAGVGIGPQTGNVTGDMLVEERLARLLKAGTPLMDQAAARAQQAANARGMSNSSLAAQAGQEAVVGAALPIAQQDANTYYNQQAQNLGYTNQFQLADKNMLGQGDLQGRQLDNQLTISREGNATQLQGAQLQASATRGAAQLAATVDRERIASSERLATMDLNSRAGEAELNRAWQATQNQLGREANTALANLNISAQERAQLAGLQQNTLVNFNQQIASIFNSTMSPEDKNRYYQNILATYTGSPYFPYQPNGTAFPPPAAPPAAPPPPPPNGSLTGNVIPPPLTRP